MPARLAALDACGLGDTLVHGDFHPGNVRTDGATLSVIDWGDSFIGHPAFDLLRLCDGCSAGDAEVLTRSGCRARAGAAVQGAPR